MDGTRIKKPSELFSPTSRRTRWVTLVQCADWGINVRMFLDNEIVELDLLKNYEGYQVTFVEERGKEPVQIDDRADLIRLLKVS